MSAYHEIFIAPAYPVESLVRDISTACGVPLLVRDGVYVDYSASLDRAAVELELEHDYEEDHGIKFEKYEALLTVRDFDRDKEREKDIAKGIFRNLAGRGTYSLALVFNLQELIESAEPSV